MDNEIVITEFPSPYGVSFILTSDLNVNTKHKHVSVSLWSIIHSYEDLYAVQSYLVEKFPSPYGVLFILIGV